MKIAITGGAGFIGSHLATAYLDAGHDVFIIDNQASKKEQAIDQRARFYNVDIRAEQLRTILQLERPDIVSHHAAQRESMPGEKALVDADVHVRGLLNVLDSCANASVRKFIFASGGNSMYGPVDNDQLLVTEHAALHPRSAQDISKVAGEWYVRYYTQQYGLKHTILRYADVYGGVRDAHMSHPINYFINMLLELRHPIIRGSGSELHDHIFIDDVVRANLSVLRRAENRTLHISTGQGSSINQLYSAVAHALESKLEPLYLAASRVSAPAILLDNTLAQHCLGWQPEVSLSSGIQQSIARVRARRRTVHVSEPCRESEIALLAQAPLTRAS